MAGPSCAVEALGFSEVPTAGDEFEVYADEKSARAVVGDRASDARATRLAQQMASRVSLTAMSGQASEGELKELNLILKADVQGSVEAILGSLEQLPKDEVQVRVLLSAPGEITETDVDLAAASGAVIIGFNTSMASGAKKAADANGVDVRDYDVIYKLLEDIQLAMEGLLEPELVEEALGEAEVRAVFTIGKSAVAGCYVTTGKLQRNCKVRASRGKEIVYAGDLDSLRRNKDDVKDVATGFECGVGCDRFANWQDGDIASKRSRWSHSVASSPPDDHAPRAPALAPVDGGRRHSPGASSCSGFSCRTCPGSSPASSAFSPGDLRSSVGRTPVVETSSGLGLHAPGALPLAGRSPINFASSALPQTLAMKAALVLGMALLLFGFWSIDRSALLVTQMSPLANGSRLTALLLAGPLLTLALWQWQQLCQAIWLLTRSDQVFENLEPVSEANSVIAPCRSGECPQLPALEWPAPEASATAPTHYGCRPRGAHG